MKDRVRHQYGRSTEREKERNIVIVAIYIYYVSHYPHTALQTGYHYPQLLQEEIETCITQMYVADSEFCLLLVLISKRRLLAIAHGKG